MSARPQYMIDGYDLDKLYPTPAPPVPLIVPPQSSPAGKRHLLDAPTDSNSHSRHALQISDQRTVARSSASRRGYRQPEKKSSPAWTAAKVVFAVVGSAAISTIGKTLPDWLIKIDVLAIGATWFAVYRLIKWRSAK
jgi:hypothetical protein